MCKTISKLVREYADVSGARGEGRTAIARALGVNVRTVRRWCNEDSEAPSVYAKMIRILIKEAKQCGS